MREPDTEMQKTSKSLKGEEMSISATKFLLSEMLASRESRFGIESEPKGIKMRTIGTSIHVKNDESCLG